MQNLENLGNFEKYKPKTRIVRTHEPVYEQDVAALKVYSMLCKKTKPFTRQEIDFAKFFVERELKLGSIDRKIGLGFLILSEGVLNVNIWGGDYPSIITPNIYTFGESGILNQNFSLKKAEEVGAYCAWEADCAWEAEIVGHEAKAWREYMFSKRTEVDKLLYIRNLYSGKIQDFPVDLLETNTSRLRIDIRTIKALRKANIISFRDLIEKTSSELSIIKGFGKNRLDSIINALGEFGLELKKP